jgi:hypothetical protein
MAAEYSSRGAERQQARAQWLLIQAAAKKVPHFLESLRDCRVPAVPNGENPAGHAGIEFWAGGATTSNSSGFAASTRSLTR